MRKSWSKAYDNPNKSNLWDATLETGLNSLNFLGAKALPGDLKAFGNAYNEIATGNSVLPIAWKSPAVGLSQEASAEMFNSLLNSNKLTPAERNIVLEYQHNSAPFTGRFGEHSIDPGKRTALNNIINKYQLQFPQNSNVIATRRFNNDRGNLGTNIENGRLNFGDRPTSFSAGVGVEGYNGAPDRIVIPSRYLPRMKNNFIANEYTPIPKEHLELIGQPSLTSRQTLIDFGSGIGTTNQTVGAERELIGTGLDFKQVGKVKNDIGGFDYIVKPRNIGATSGKSGNITMDKWPNIFRTSNVKPTAALTAEEQMQAELDLANARAKTFSESAFNKLKLQRFRPGQTFDVSHQEARFMDDPELIKQYNQHHATDPTNPPTFDEWFKEGHGTYGPSGRYGSNNFGDRNDIVAINKLSETTGEPAKNILLDTAHESTHSRAIRLKSTQAERDIATDAWKPMIDESGWTTGPASGFNPAAEESFAVQNELRGLLNDFDGSRVYTDADIPEIQNALQKLVSTGHPYLSQNSANQIDMKKLIKSLNEIGLGVGVGTVIGVGALQKKKTGGQIPKAQFGFGDDIFKRRVLNKYPVMKNIYGNKGEDLNIIRDRNFDASSHGFGDIEFIFPGSGTVNYSDDYTYQSPTPDKYTAVYNPKGAGRGDVFLDMLHGMRNDPGYNELLQNFGNTVKDARGEDMRFFYERELAEGRAPDGQDHWNDNYIDGMLRAELYPYTPGRASGRKDYAIERQESSPEMQKAAMDIYNYLNTKPKKVNAKKEGGPVKKVKITALPKNWKTK